MKSRYKLMRVNRGSFFIMLMALCLLMSVGDSTQRIYAALVDQGDGSIADTDRGILYYDVTYSSNDWNAAVSWVNSLNTGAGTLGYTDWRLPSALNSDGSGPCVDPSTCSDSELGHLYFVEGVTTVTPMVFTDFPALDPINSISPYWTSTVGGGGSYWIFAFHNGAQHTHTSPYLFAGTDPVGFAVAVRDMADVDGDGYYDAAEGGDDCNDGDITVYPGAPELCDGQDNDCDGSMIYPALVDNADSTITDADRGLMFYDYSVIPGDCSAADTWISDLNIANTLGYNNWRLPSALNSDGSGPCSGAGCFDSELGHLNQVEGISPAVGIYGPFTDLKNYIYYASGGWIYAFHNLGNAQHTHGCSEFPGSYAMAVRDVTPFSIEGDADGDGYVLCDVDSGGWDGAPISGGSDCSDGNGNVNPGETETLYNGIDDDCNAATLDYSWKTDTLDSGAVGYGTSIALDSSGYVHISYNDITTDDLKYASNAGGSWAATTVDSTAGIVGGFNSIALDSSGNVHISYLDGTNFHLKYATNSGVASGTGNCYAGSDFDCTTVDSTAPVGFFTSIALDSSGNVHISYSDWDNYDLKYATNSGVTSETGNCYAGSDFDCTTVDSTEDVGDHTSIVLDSSGNVHISYLDASNLHLKYATNSGVTSGTGNCYAASDFDCTTVDSPGVVGYYTSIAMDSSGNVHISYFDNNPNYDLKYATNSDVDPGTGNCYAGSDFDCTTVDSAGIVGFFTSIAIDSSGNVHIGYYDSTNTDLKYATTSGVTSGTGNCYAGSDFDCTTVNSTGSVGEYTSIAMDSSGYVHISYRDTDGDLEYATNALVCGDGVIEGTETCDDGNTVDGDGCGATCIFEGECGDGIVQTGEECDDGNVNNGDGCEADCTFLCVDGDGDGYGLTGTELGGCAGSTTLADCDDNDLTEFPGGLWYWDADGDGYTEGSTISACERQPDFYRISELIDFGDCDDSSNVTFPGAASNDSVSDCMKDADGDDYGDNSPPGSVTAGTDCWDENDPDAAITYPGAAEVCDGDDNDCDGASDEDFTDNEGDGTGDACDDDDDNDGVSDVSDNCPSDFNPLSDWTDIGIGGNPPAQHLNEQPDIDLDGTGDDCDKDADNDGYCNGETADETGCNLDPQGYILVDCDDADPTVFHQVGCTEGGFAKGGKNSGGSTDEPDSDGDGVVDSDDNCEGYQSSDTTDDDSDGFGNPCDLCDDTGFTDIDLTNDPDNDGVCYISDNCPSDSNPPSDWTDRSNEVHINEQPDYDRDGIGDACDSDADNDGHDSATDCDDLDESVNPGVEIDIPDNLKDDDCDSSTPDSTYRLKFDMVDADGNPLTYNTWLPDQLGTEVTLTAKAVDTSGNEVSANITISYLDSDVSAYPGKYTNDTSTDGSPDYTSITVKAGSYGDNVISMTPNDYAATIRIKADIDIDGFGFTRYHYLPRDENNNNLADAWEELPENHLSGVTLTETGDVDYTTAPGGDIGDDWSNVQEYRGFKWGTLDLDASGEYQTSTVYVPGTVKHFRGSAYRHELFVVYQDFSADYPFAIGTAFKDARIDVHPVDHAVDTASTGVDIDSLLHVLVVLKDDTFGTETGHIKKQGDRNWTFRTLGYCGVGDAIYVGQCWIYKKAIDFYWSDLPYVDGGYYEDGSHVDHHNPNGLLDVSEHPPVEDFNDDGVLKTSGSRTAKEDKDGDNKFDGDYYSIGKYNVVEQGVVPSGLGLTPLNIDGDEYMELPLQSDPTDMDPAGIDTDINNDAIEFTKKHVIMHVVTHEIAHGIGASGDHSPILNDLMFLWSTDWLRSHHFDDDTIATFHMHQ